MVIPSAVEVGVQVRFQIGGDERLPILGAEDKVPPYDDNTNRNSSGHGHGHDKHAIMGSNARRARRAASGTDDFGAELRVRDQPAGCRYAATALRLVASI